MVALDNTPLEKGKQFYVYSYSDPRNGEVFYIGKGSGNRYKQVHEGQRNSFFSNKFNKIVQEGMEPGVEVVYSTKDETAAYELEEFLISEIGRWSEGGTLTNLSAGGEGNTNYYFDKSFYDRLGVVRDQELADEYGCCRELVCYHRNSLGIPHLPRTYDTPPPPMGGWNKTNLPQECIDKMGHVSDRELAREFKVNRSVIQKRRKSLGIGTYREVTGYNGVGERRNVDKEEYLFENTDTGETFSGLRVDFADHIGVRPTRLSPLVKGRCKTIYKWRLVND